MQFQRALVQVHVSLTYQTDFVLTGHYILVKAGNIGLKTTELFCISSAVPKNFLKGVPAVTEWEFLG